MENEKNTSEEVEKIPVPDCSKVTPSEHKETDAEDEVPLVSMYKNRGGPQFTGRPHNWK